MTQMDADNEAIAVRESIRARDATSKPAAWQIQYDEDLVETAVFRCANGARKGISSLQMARFQREREKLYRILDPDERESAFFQLHLEWFREWGLEDILTAALGEFPLF